MTVKIISETKQNLKFADAYQSARGPDSACDLDPDRVDRQAFVLQLAPTDGSYLPMSE